MSGVKNQPEIKNIEIMNCSTFVDDDLCYEFVTNYFYVNENVFLCLLI